MGKCCLKLVKENSQSIATDVLMVDYDRLKFVKYSGLKVNFMV